MRFEIANKRRFVLVVLALFAFLLVAWVVASGRGQGRTDKKVKEVGQKAPVNPFAELKTSVALIYLGAEKTFPSEAETYRLDSQALSAEEVKSLAAKFGFTKAPTINEDKVQGKVYFWNGAETTLRWREKQQVLKYALKNAKVVKGTASLSFDEAKRVAQAFLEEYGLWSGLSFQESYQYLKNLETAAAPTEARSSEGIKVTLTYTVGNLPLWDEFLGGEPVNVIVLNDGRVAFVSYLFFRSAQLKSAGTLPLKTLAEARQNLSRGEGLAVSSLSKNPERAEATPVSGLLNQVQLVLFHSLETSTAQPFFVFSGSAVRVLFPAAANP